MPNCPRLIAKSPRATKSETLGAVAINYRKPRAKAPWQIRFSTISAPLRSARVPRLQTNVLQLGFHPLAAFVHQEMSPSSDPKC